MALDEESLSIGLGGRDDEEGVFSRDINGQLVRVDAPTESDYETQVTIQIDGRPVEVPLAEPLKDAQGNIVLDLQGRTTPRYTTVYDAAMKLHSGYRSESADPDAPPTVGPGGVPLAD